VYTVLDHKECLEWAVPKIVKVFVVQIEAKKLSRLQSDDWAKVLLV
jgi:hypothetical protein